MPNMPTRCNRIAKRVLFVTVPVTLGGFVTAAILSPAECRPLVLVMGYMTLLGACMVAAMAVLVARCQMAIHEAFGIGLRAGMNAAQEPPATVPSRTALRVVE